jgi:hypothetical protein
MAPLKKAGTILPIALMFLPAALCLAAPSPQAIEAKLALESSVEKRLETVLQQALDSKNVIVIVNVQLVEAQSDSDSDVLPGVPAKDSPGTPAALALSSTLVRRISATVFLDRAAPAADEQLARSTVEGMLGIDARRGDVVAVERINFQKPVVAGAVAQSFIRFPQDVFSLLWLLTACLGLYLFSRLIAPLSILFTQTVESLKTIAASRGRERERDVESTAASQTFTAGMAVGISGGPEVPKKDPSHRKLPFSFVEAKDIPTLKLLLRDQDPAKTALVLHFLPTDMASDILTSLPAETRDAIFALMRRPTALDPGQVTRIEDAVRAQVDYLMGGEQQLLALLDRASPALKASVLADLHRAEPAMAKRLMKQVVILDDLSNLDEAGVKILARQVPITHLAAAVRSSENLRRAVLANLHAGTADWLIQEIELAADVPPIVLESRINQVVAALTKLVREGTIVLHKKDSSEVVSAPLEERGAPLLLIDEEGPALRQPSALPAAMERSLPKFEAPAPSPASEEEQRIMADDGAAAYRPFAAAVPPMELLPMAPPPSSVPEPLKPLEELSPAFPSAPPPLSVPEPVATEVQAPESLKTFQFPAMPLASEPPPAPAQSPKNDGGPTNEPADPTPPMRWVALDELSKLDADGFKTLARQVPIRNLVAAIRSSESLRKAVTERIQGSMGSMLGQAMELAVDPPPDVLRDNIGEVEAALTKLVFEGRVVLGDSSGTANS